MLEPAAVPHHPRPSDVLTRREAEVLEMAALGLTNNQLAARLNVSIHAVKFHLAAIYRKLHVANRTEAVVVYLQADRVRPVDGDDAVA